MASVFARMSIATRLELDHERRQGGHLRPNSSIRLFSAK
jgi:hypothetical protein